MVLSMTGDEIKKIRKLQDWSQRQLGDYLGIEQATVSRLEAGEWQPSGPVRKLLESLRTMPRSGEAA